MSHPGFYHKPHIYPDGNQWCAVWVNFRDLALDPAGFGDTPKDAVWALGKEHRRIFKLSDFEIGGFCRECHCFVPNGFKEPGCSRADCPCQPPNIAEPRR